MTSNEPIEAIKALLDRENEKDPNIHISYNIHESVEFLDVFIENIQGELTTSVFRKPAAEPYILPYTSDHPRHVHSNTIYTALLRAVRLCSDVETFDKERLNIEIALLLNGYSPKFITYHYKQFFEKYNASSIYQDLHAETYKQVHFQLLNESLTDDQVPPQSEQQQQLGDQSKNSYIKSKPIKQMQLILHYRYESGPLKTFSREFRKLWKAHLCYENSSLNNVRLILGTRTNKTLEHLLVNKKPCRTLLKNTNSHISSTTMET